MFRPSFMACVAYVLAIASAFMASPCIARDSISAQKSASVDDLVAQANQKGLAHDPYWHALLHYHGALFSPRGLRSDIITPDFFLAPQGRFDPSAELAATIRAMIAPPANDQNDHAQCRFIARYHWLRRQLDWSGTEAPPVVCARFVEWSRQGQITSLSLIFATGYLGNPASYYGHLLLKFNVAQSQANSNDLLNKSMNYGADIPPNENGIAYVINGLFGGYEAGFSHEMFYRMNQVYVENELRDLWEYELALDKTEVDQIVAHSWELLGNKFDYYFVKENCAYRMAELLELIIDEPLLPDITPWSIPSSVFDRLAQVSHRGQPLVRDVRRIPSRQNRFHDSFDRLETHQQRVLEQLIARPLDLTMPAYTALAIKAKVAVVDTLLEYYEFRRLQDSDQGAYKNEKNRLLIERIELPPATELPPAPVMAQPPAPPHAGPRPTLARISVLTNSHLGEGIELRLRPTYYDSLALDGGRIANAHLAMFDLRIAMIDEAPRLRVLDFVNIETLNLSHTGLPGDGGFAWKLRFGLQDLDLSCHPCTIAHLTSGIGKAYAISQGGVGYAMIDGSVRTPREDVSTLSASAYVGLIMQPLPGWKTMMLAGREGDFGGSREKYSRISWENRFGAQRDWDIRLTYNKQLAEEWQLGFSRYW